MKILLVVNVGSLEKRSNQPKYNWRTKNEKSKDYCKADLKQRVLFFITVFRLAIPAFFRFTDVLHILYIIIIIIIIIIIFNIYFYIFYIFFSIYNVDL